MLPWPAISTAPDLYLAKHIAALLAANVGCWYDPADLTTLFQDTAGTTPVTAVGQSVGLMGDKSGRGYHLSQANAAARPILRQDALGFYYLEFDGFDDTLASAATYSAGATHYIATAAMRVSASNLQIFGATTSSSRYSRLRSIGTGDRVVNNYRVAVGSYEAVVTSSPVGVTKVFDGLSGPGYLDAGMNGVVVTVVTATTAADSIPNAVVAIGVSRIRFYGGMTLVGDPGAATRKIIQKYLASKYGARL